VLRQDRLYDPPPALEVAATHGDEPARALVFQRALSRLRGGGFVLAPLDVPAGAARAAACLGRRLELARGPLALARLGGAPLVPVTARWRRRRIVAEAHAPVVVDGGLDPRREPERWEEALAARTAAWLGDWLREHPGETGLGLLRALLSAPPADR
jgi:hypothetical protein